MNEITHPQARRMLRKAQDRRLPEEQWAMLQAHLENCADCRAYQARLGRMDKDLRRLLRARWERAPQPRRDIAAALRARDQRRAKVQRGLSYAWLVLLLPLVYLLYLNMQRAPQGPGSERGAQPSVTPSSTPDRFAAARQQGVPSFLGSAVFQGEQEGNSEIYLLNANGPEVELVNLTQHPAADTDPVWSPDGEWIAFLSDRPGTGQPLSSGGASVERSKRELYTMHVSGARLTRVTVDPNIHWRGPLSWSPDGEQIAAVGVRVRPGELNRPPGQVYLIPLDGSSPYPLGGTQGASFPRFAPQTGLLAYQVERGRRAGLEALSLLTGHRAELTGYDTAARLLSAGAGGAFDWSPDGRSLLYTTFGPLEPLETLNGEGGRPMRELKHTLLLNQELSSPYDSTGNLTVASTNPSSRFTDALWTPDGRAVLYLQTFENPEVPRAGGTPCSYLTHRVVSQTQTVPDVAGPCVEGALDSASWSSDGQWMLFYGFEDADTHGVYAMYYEGGRLRPFPSSYGPVFQHLVENVRVTGAVLTRPDQAAAAEARPALPPQANTLSAEGSLVFGMPPEPLISRALLLRRASGDGRTAADLNAGYQIVRPRNGGQSWVAVVGPGQISCPSLSPNGQTIAYLANLGEDPWNELHLFLSVGRSSRQLTSFEFMTRLFPEQWSYPLPRFGCPVWSPDGQRLAAVVDTGQGQFLAVLSDLEGEVKGQYFAIQTASTVDTLPRWSADGRSVLLAYRALVSQSGPGGPLHSTGSTQGSGPLVIAAAEPLENPPDDVALPSPNLPSSPGAAGPRAGTAQPTDSPAPAASPATPQPPDTAASTASTTTPQPTESLAPAAGVITPTHTSYPATVTSTVTPSPTESPATAANMVTPTPTPTDSGATATLKAALGGPEPGRPVNRQGVVNPAQEGTPLAANPNAPAMRPVLELRGSDQITGLSISPDGRWLAYLETDIEPDYEARSRLRLAGIEGFPLLQWADLPIYSGLSAANGYRGLTWWGAGDMSLLPGGQLGLVFYGSPASRDKAALYVFEPETRALRLLARIPDLLYDAAFAPDGSWVLFSSESGLYALEVEPALRGRAIPILLSRETVLDISWE